MIERMIDCDIADIKQAMHNDDYAFLYAVLSGEGWIPYNQLSDNAVKQTYLTYEFDEGDE